MLLVRIMEKKRNGKRIREEKGGHRCKIVNRRKGDVTRHGGDEIKGCALRRWIVKTLVNIGRRSEVTQGA